MVKAIHQHVNTELRTNAEKEFEKDFFKLTLFLEKHWKMKEIMSILN